MSHTSNLSETDHVKIILEHTIQHALHNTYRQFPVNQQGLGLNDLDVIHFKELQSLEVREDTQ